MWNPARGVWEIPMENILCAHWGLFSATFPTSGMMRDGKLFPLPLLAHRTVESEFSLLRTPVASEAEGGAIHPDDAKAGGNTLKLGWQMLALGGHIHPKLPTPNTMDMLPARTGEARERQLKRGDPNGKPRASSGNLRETVLNDLLPTPQTGDGERGMTSTPEHRQATGHQVMLCNHAPQLTESWGKFAPAIHQWETITGNPAPTPTIPDGRDGQARLNPQFAEWMMGLPAGWITDCDITRNEQLKACGNGVVPQQATLAITRLLQGITL
jgi:hypothetical protein